MPSSNFTYRQALRFVDKYVNYEKLPDYRYTQAAFRLDRMIELLRLLGNPHKNFKSVHIAGTKGKGTTATMVALLLKHHGFKTGLYTSPHISDIRERIKIDGLPISPANFAKIISAMRSKIRIVEKKMIPVTYFEIMTALALEEFSRKRVRFASVEVGIGGRLDATNVIVPEVSCITNISYDHMDKLGDTLSQIAGEKCGIIKPQVPVVSAPQKPEALRVIKQVVREKRASLVLVGKDILIGGREFIAETKQRRYPAPRLLSAYLKYCAHAWEDAAVALGALEVVAERCGFKVDSDCCREAFENFEMEGRFEIASGKPMLIFDGAHNEASAQALAKSLKTFAKENNLPLRRPFTFLISIARDKDISGFLKQILPVAGKIVFTTSSNPRCVDPFDLRQRLRRVSSVDIDAEYDIPTAFWLAKESAGEDGVLVISGSFYLLGEVKKILQDK